VLTPCPLISEIGASLANRTQVDDGILIHCPNPRSWIARYGRSSELFQSAYKSMMIRADRNEKQLIPMSSHV
jgi:hypothetical protein